MFSLRKSKKIIFASVATISIFITAISVAISNIVSQQAVFGATTNTMQDITNEELARRLPNNGDSITLVDSRDNNSYAIKNIGGKYWMTQNLRLTGGSGTKTLRASDTNISFDYTMPKESPSQEDPTAYFNSGSETKEGHKCSTNTNVGCWYNYHSAVAGYSTHEVTQGGVPYQGGIRDICPKGWHLPSTSEFQSLYGDQSTTGWQPATSGLTAFNAVAGGDYYNDAIRDTQKGSWWSSSWKGPTTVSFSGNGYGYYYDTNEPRIYYFAYNSEEEKFAIDKKQSYAGSFVRCVKHEKRTITFEFDSNIQQIIVDELDDNESFVKNIGTIDISGGNLEVEGGKNYLIKVKLDNNYSVDNTFLNGLDTYTWNRRFDQQTSTSYFTHRFGQFDSKFGITSTPISKYNEVIYDANTNTEDDVENIPSSAWCNYEATTQNSCEIQLETFENKSKPKRDGYFFLGWSAEKNAQNGLITSIETKTEKTTVYAQWAEKQNLTWRAGSRDDLVIPNAALGLDVNTTIYGQLETIYFSDERPNENGVVYGNKFSLKGSGCIVANGRDITIKAACMQYADVMEKWSQNGDRIVYIYLQDIYKNSLADYLASITVDPPNQGTESIVYCADDYSKGGCFYGDISNKKFKISETPPWERPGGYSISYYTMYTNAVDYTSYVYPGEEYVLNDFYGHDLGNHAALVASWKKPSPTINFTSPTITKTIGDESFTNDYSTNSEGYARFSSSDNKVATVDPFTGEVSIKGAGNVNITVKIDPSEDYSSGSASYELVVNKKQATASFAEPNKTVNYGHLMYPSENRLNTNSDGTKSYVSSNENVATVDSSGYVEAVGVGQATITVEIAESANYTSTSASFNITVNKSIPTAKFSSTSLTENTTTPDFINTLTTNSTGAQSYSSSNPDVATVGQSTGIVSIVGVGTTKITVNIAATDVYNEQSAEYTLKVNKTNPNAKFASSNVSKTTGADKFTNTFTTSSDGVKQYYSNNTEVAEVDQDTGEVTIKGIAGRATIGVMIEETDKFNEASATYSLSVSRGTPKVSFEASIVNKNVNDPNFTYKAITVSDGGIVYSSSNTAVATVDNTTGEVTIKGAGETTITAETGFTLNNYASSGSYKLIVSNKTTPTTNFADTSMTKTYGDAKFTNALTTESNGAKTYRSSNENVATVSSTGEVTIVSAGSTEITVDISEASAYAATSASYILTVDKKKSDAPSEISTTQTGYVGDELSTIELTTTGLVWKNSSEQIKKGENEYLATYTQGADDHNYTTEEFKLKINGKERVYIMFEGGAYIEVKSGEDGNNSGMTKFKYNGDSSILMGSIDVYVDKVLLDPQYYEVNQSDNAINISNAYLESLPGGNHIITIQPKNGAASTAVNFIVSVGDDDFSDDKEIPVPNTSAASASSPDTGENTKIQDAIIPVTLISLPVIAAPIAFGLYSRKKVKFQKYD